MTAPNTPTPLRDGCAGPTSGFFTCIHSKEGFPVEWKGGVDTVRAGIKPHDCPIDADCPLCAYENAARRIADALESAHRRAEGLEAERDRLRGEVPEGWEARKWGVKGACGIARSKGSPSIERVGQITGPDLYAVRSASGWVLNKSGEWEYEPMPSSRDDEFIKRCRFPSLQAAIEAIAAITHTVEAP